MPSLVLYRIAPFRIETYFEFVTPRTNLEECGGGGLFAGELFGLL